MDEPLNQVLFITFNQIGSKKHYNYDIVELGQTVREPPEKVGINTSALIENTLQNRTVSSIRSRAVDSC